MVLIIQTGMYGKKKKNHMNCSCSPMMVLSFQHQWLMFDIKQFSGKESVHLSMAHLVAADGEH